MSAQPPRDPGTPTGPPTASSTPASDAPGVHAGGETTPDLAQTDCWAPPAGAGGSSTVARADGSTTSPAALGQATPYPSVPGYEVLEELGRGGMGVVYKARQTALKRLVALKVILAQAHAGPEERGRFRREAEAEARLQHPNIVAVYEVGEHQGLDYFALEYVGGGSLAQRLQGRPFPALEAAALTASLARAVQHAHERGIVHRDLKPANILLQGPGAESVKITDFGLAKQIEGDSGQTRSGAIMGTPSYMAPEQAAGDVHAVGPHSDIWALGAILYELLTGRPPFKGATIRQTLEQVCTQEPRPVRQIDARVPRDLETICLKALAREPAQRYSSALALANDLDRFRAGEPILARRQGPLGRVWRRVRRHPMAVLATIVVAGALGLSGLLIVRSRAEGRVTAIQRELATMVASLDPCSDDHIGRATGLLHELATADPAAATDYRTQLTQRQYEALKEAIETPGLEAGAQVDRLHHGVELLASSDTQRATDLGRLLTLRVKRWEQVFALGPSLDHADEVFMPGQVRLDGRALRTTSQDSRAVTRAPCGTHVEVEAVFKPSGDSGAMGTLLNVLGEAGYGFVLQSIAPSGGVPGHRLRITIRRNRAVLREQVLTLDRPPESIKLVARREGNLLSAQVDDDVRLEFRDPFPLVGDGAIGVICPAQAALEQLRAARRSAAADPGALEQGDAMYEKGRFADALTFYRSHARTGSAAEARYKEGLCLDALGRQAEALAVFQEVSAGPDADWANLAACRAWGALAARKDTQARELADALLENLRARGLAAEQLAALVPEDVRRRILDAHARYVSVGEYFSESADVLVSRYQRAADVHRLLDTDPANVQSALEGLMRAYHFAGQDAAAHRLAEEIMKASPVFPGPWDFDRRALIHRVWMYIGRGKPAEGLALLDTWLPRVSESAAKEAYVLPQLRLERTRLLAALARWPDAEREVDAVLASSPTAAVVAEACLLKGFLCERRGATDEARNTWRRGGTTVPQLGAGGGPSVDVYRYIMLALSDALDETQLAQVRTRMLSLPEAPGTGGFMLEKVVNILPAEAIKQLWLSPRGRRAAWRIAWREASLAETYQLPGLLLVSEWMRQSAFGGKVTEDQDRLLWDLVTVAHSELVAHRLPLEQLSLWLLTWKGNTLFWATLAGRMPPPLRGPLAYVLGQRYRRLGKPTEAQTFFKTAHEAAPAGSLLLKLAAAELSPTQSKPRPSP